MSIKVKIEEMLKDESKGTDEYGKLAREALTSDEIPDKYKSAVAGLLETMSRDEDKHFHFLQFIAEML